MASTPGGTRRKLFKSPVQSPSTVRRRTDHATTTTTVPLKETGEEDELTAAVTPSRRRGRPRKSNGTPAPQAGVKRRAGSPISRNPRRVRTDKFGGGGESSIQLHFDEGKENFHTTPAPAKRGRPPKAQAVQPSSELGPTKRGRRRQAMAPDELVGIAEEAAERSQVQSGRRISESDAVDLIQPPPSRQGAEHDAAHGTGAASDAETESDWIPGPDNEATPKATAQPSTLRLPSNVDHDNGAPEASDHSTVDEHNNDYSSQANDTIAQGEDFSMIFMDSIPSLQRSLNGNSSFQPAEDDEEVGDDTHLIINNTLASLRREVAQSSDPVEATEQIEIPEEPEIEDQPEPEPEFVPIIRESARNARLSLSPWWSRKPKKMGTSGASPLRHQTLLRSAAKRSGRLFRFDQREDEPTPTKAGKQPSSAQSRRDSSNDYRDSFSGNVRTYLDTAAPKPLNFSATQDDRRVDLEEYGLHREDEHVEGEHAREEHAEDRVEEEHAEGEQAEGENAQEEHIKEEPAEEEYAEEEHAEEDHVEEEHAEEEFAEEEHAEGEYAEEEDVEEEHAEASAWHSEAPADGSLEEAATNPPEQFFFAAQTYSALALGPRRIELPEMSSPVRHIEDEEPGYEEPGHEEHGRYEDYAANEHHGGYQGYEQGVHGEYGEQNESTEPEEHEEHEEHVEHEEFGEHGGQGEHQEHGEYGEHEEHQVYEDHDEHEEHEEPLQPEEIEEEEGQEQDMELDHEEEEREEAQSTHHGRQEEDMEEYDEELEAEEHQQSGGEKEVDEQGNHKESQEALEEYTEQEGIEERGEFEAREEHEDYAEHGGFEEHEELQEHGDEFNLRDEHDDHEDFEQHDEHDEFEDHGGEVEQNDEHDQFEEYGDEVDHDQFEEHGEEGDQYDEHGQLKEHEQEVDQYEEHDQHGEGIDQHDEQDELEEHEAQDHETQEDEQEELEQHELHDKHEDPQEVEEREHHDGRDEHEHYEQREERNVRSGFSNRWRPNYLARRQLDNKENELEEETHPVPPKQPEQLEPTPEREVRPYEFSNRWRPNFLARRRPENKRKHTDEEVRSRSPQQPEQREPTSDREVQPVEATPPQQMSSPLQDPQSVPQDHVQYPVLRPVLSSIMRAGRVLQTVTSDPPSPREREKQLRSPFRSSASKEASHSVTEGSQPPPSKSPPQPFRFSRDQSAANGATANQRRSAGSGLFGTGFGSTRPTLDGSVREPLNRTRPPSRESEASSLGNTPSRGGTTNLFPRDRPISFGFGGRGNNLLPQPSRFSGISSLHQPLPLVQVDGTGDEPDRVEEEEGEDQDQVQEDANERAEEEDQREEEEQQEEQQEEEDQNEEEEDDDDDDIDLWEYEAQREVPPRPVLQQPLMPMTQDRDTAPGPASSWRDAQKAPAAVTATRPLSNALRAKQTIGRQTDREVEEDISPVLSRKQPEQAPATASKSKRFDLSSFFSSPAALPGLLAEKFKSTKPTASAEQTDQQAAAQEEEPPTLPPTSLFPRLDQTVNGSRDLGRTAHPSSSIPSDPPVDVQVNEDASSRATPEERGLPTIAQKQNFAPRPRQANDTSFFQPSSSQLSTSPTRMQLTHEDIQRWQLETSHAGDDSPSLKPLLRPLPPRHASPKKSNLRSPLKPHTPGRVVEFSGSVLSPEEQARLREQRLRANEDVTGEDLISTAAAVPNHVQPRAGKGSMPRPQPQQQQQKQSRPSMLAPRVIKPAGVTKKPPIRRHRRREPPSQTVWTRQHWIFLDTLLQMRRQRPFSERYAPVSQRYLGKVVTSMGESLVLEKWHLECVDAFKSQIKGWDEGELAKRLFALILGEAQRRRASLGQSSPGVMFH
ncbi:hypothetical protein V8C26DRAFT_417339 [Trichoderma gracile]